MSDCCASSCKAGSLPGKHVCPVNGIEYKQVSFKTVMHHLEKPWRWGNTTQNYYFCDDPECNVVYFGDDDSLVSKDELRTVVGIKEKSEGSTICYCFGASKGDVMHDPAIKDYVTLQTKDHMCDCEVRNPSGRCCLKDFPKS